MTATATAPHTSQGTARTRKAIITIMAICVGVIVLILLALIARPETSTRDYALDNPDKNGAQALGEVLKNEGVQVHEAGSIEAVARVLTQHPDATVLMLDTEAELYSATPERQAQVRSTVPDSQLVIAVNEIDEYEGLTEGITLNTGAGVPTPQRFTPEPFAEETDRVSPPAHSCDIPAALNAGTISVSTADLYVPKSEDEIGDMQFCYGPSTYQQGALHFGVEVDDEEPLHGALVRDAAGNMVLGVPDILMNQNIASEGNAALAMWLLGETEHLVWFDTDFLAGASPSTGLSDAQIPDWARFMVYWLFIAFVVIAVWLGRRHGPVVVEPLPSEVKPAEITVGRARMHARSRHSDHALTQLHDATLRRLRQTLHLGTGTSAEVIIAQTASVLGKPYREVAELFTPGKPSDTQLVRAAQALKDLEHQVTDAVRHPHGTAPLNPTDHDTTRHNPSRSSHDIS